jgi:hypothetical protein
MHDPSPLRRPAGGQHRPRQRYDHVPTHLYQVEDAQLGLGTIDHEPV